MSSHIHRAAILWYFSRSSAQPAYRCRVSYRIAHTRDNNARNLAAPFKGVALNPSTRAWQHSAASTTSPPSHQRRRE
eukprot:1158342-Pleurochrysis_carterae.AAC.3